VYFCIKDVMCSTVVICGIGGVQVSTGGVIRIIILEVTILVVTPRVVERKAVTDLVLREGAI
jgi:hypothetical protein